LTIRPETMAWIQRTTVLFLGALVLLGESAFAAERAIPPSVEGYSPGDREMAATIVDRPTFQAARKLPFRADPDVFRFLIDQPDFAAAVSRGIGHDRFRILPERGRYRIFHGHARGVFWAAERRPGRAAYLAKGVYENPAFAWLGIVVRARSYVVEDFMWAALGNSGTSGSVAIRAYLHVENVILDWVFRIIAPLVRKAFEDKLTGAYRIAPDLSRMAYRDANGFLEKVRKIEGLDPARLNAFEKLVKRRARPPGP